MTSTTDHRGASTNRTAWERHVADYSVLADLDRRPRAIEERFNHDQDGHITGIGPVRVRSSLSGRSLHWVAVVPRLREARVRAAAAANGLEVDLAADPVQYRDHLVELSGPLPATWASCGCVSCSHPLLGFPSCRCVEVGCWCATEGHQRVRR